jgi:PAS domain S-box-containing protein
MSGQPVSAPLEPVDPPRTPTDQPPPDAPFAEGGSSASRRNVAVSVALDPDPRNVRQARNVLRDALLRSGAEDLLDPATLLLSEIVTNAFVHAGTQVQVQVQSTAEALRVEVRDGGAHVPFRRHYSGTAGTGRGVQLMDELADRWGTEPGSNGKTVWFEMGNPPTAGNTVCDGAHGELIGEAEGTRQVTLRCVPLLMHQAWQEHAATLLREYLLHVLDDDDDILDKHAQASEAMSLLNLQLPAPSLPPRTDALMAAAIEPTVTADEVVLRIPVASIPHFATLDALLRSAITEARAGRFLSPPTQPEIDEMRQWICSEIARQTSGDTTATPWMARTDVRATLVDQAALTATYSALAAVDEPLLATDEASIIVAASQPALDLLGYQHVDELLGRRVIVVVPARFHQAHIAGTTLHATNGRDNLLGVPITVPMVRADGTEVSVHIQVRPERLDADHRVFVARFRPS